MPEQVEKCGLGYVHRLAEHVLCLVLVCDIIEKESKGKQRVTKNNEPQPHLVAAWSAISMEGKGIWELGFQQKMK
jgi:hypothetical protein